jgi:GNAT superfamily N-acetyltransferase
MIRPMLPRDRERVLGLVKETGMFTEAEVAVAEELIDIYLNDPRQKDYSVVVVENERGEPAGYMTWGPTPLAEDAYDLYWMAVSPAEQGRGYGQRLVRWLEDEVKARRGRLVIVETSSQPKYLPTREFYLKLGYAEVARVPDFYRPGDDRVIYTKKFR